MVLFPSRVRHDFEIPKVHIMCEQGLIWLGKPSRKANPYVAREIWNENLLCVRPSLCLPCPHPCRTSLIDLKLVPEKQECPDRLPLGWLVLLVIQQPPHCPCSPADPMLNWLHPGAFPWLKMSYCHHGREGNGNPLQYPCLENSDRGVWQATIHGVAESDTAERLSMHTHTAIVGAWYLPAWPSLRVMSACCISSPGSAGWASSAGAATMADHLPRFSFPSFCLPFPYIDSFVFFSTFIKREAERPRDWNQDFFSPRVACSWKGMTGGPFGQNGCSNAVKQRAWPGSSPSYHCQSPGKGAASKYLQSIFYLSKEMGLFAPVSTPLSQNDPQPHLLWKEMNHWRLDLLDGYGKPRALSAPPRILTDSLV